MESEEFMTENTRMRIRTCLAGAALGVACLVAGCGKEGLSGTYRSQGDKSEMIFQPGGTVDVVGLAVGSGHGTYKRDGNRLELSFVGMQTIVVPIAPDGCFNGGELFGRFCKQ